MEESEQSGDPAADDVLSVIRRFHELGVITQNPLYCFLALEALIRPHLDANLEWPKGQDLSIPDWTVDYLSWALRRLMSLASGVDYRVDVPLVDFSKFSSLDDFQNSAERRGYHDASAIPAARAMELVPAALGLTRDGGWNAFASFESTTSKMHQYRAYQAMREAGVTSKAALHAIGAAIGVSDPSRMHARIREGKSLAEGGDVVEPGG